MVAVGQQQQSSSGVIAVVGGGSAGHVVPALPVIDQLLARQWSVHFIGTRSGFEEKLLQDRDVTFHGIAAGKLRRYLDWQNVTDVGRVAWAVIESLVLLRRIKPRVVFSKGGFVSLPLVFAAWLLRVPVVAHESDLTPGLANRLASSFVRTFCISFAETVLPGCGSSQPGVARGLTRVVTRLYSDSYLWPGQSQWCSPDRLFGI